MANVSLHVIIPLQLLMSLVKKFDLWLIFRVAFTRWKRYWKINLCNYLPLQSVQVLNMKVQSFLINSRSFSPQGSSPFIKNIFMSHLFGLFPLFWLFFFFLKGALCKMLLLIPILSANGLFGLSCLFLKSWGCDLFQPFEFTCFSPVYTSSLWWKTCLFALMQQSLMILLAWFGPKAKPTLFFAGNRSPLPLYFLTNLQIRRLIWLMLSVNRHICQNVTALHLSPSACTFYFYFL